VKLAVYDFLGYEVQVRVTEDWRLGKNSIVWDAGNLPSGTYFVRLEMLQCAGTLRHSETREVMLLK